MGVWFKRMTISFCRASPASALQGMADAVVAKFGKMLSIIALGARAVESIMPVTCAVRTCVVSFHSQTAVQAQGWNEFAGAGRNMDCIALARAHTGLQESAPKTGSSLASG
jgi:hypothetical protein